MLTLPNSLSILRAPLAFLFLIDNAALRFGLLVTAMVSDFFDGYLARRQRNISELGAFLDPAMDKFFVGGVLTIFYFEEKLAYWQVLALMGREFFLLLFSFYIFSKGLWPRFRCRSTLCSKVTTTLQFVLIAAVVLDFSFPSYCYVFFVLLGAISYAELWVAESKRSL